MKCKGIRYQVGEGKSKQEGREDRKRESEGRRKSGERERRILVEGAALTSASCDGALPSHTSHRHAHTHTHTHTHMHTHTPSQVKEEREHKHMKGTEINSSISSDRIRKENIKAQTTFKAYTMLAFLRSLPAASTTTTAPYLSLSCLPGVSSW